MKRALLFLIMIACLSQSKAYSQQIEVVTLGVFHFEFPNLDAVQISEKDQIDVLLPKYQDEIEMIAEKLAKFKPDVIVIERPMNRQGVIDSIYSQFYTHSTKPRCA